MAAETAPAEARTVLSKHCAECHGDGPRPRADLRVLDFQGLRERQVVRPGEAARSDLVRLVQAGSMPPGRLAKLTPDDMQKLRDWIKEGAADYTPESPDAPVLRAIAADLRQQAAEDPAVLRSLRYVSFYHLRDKVNPATCRDALTLGLNLVSLGFSPVKPVPLPGLKGLVFRINLKTLGWDATPFATERGPDKKVESLRWNLYDLVLLEYPLAPGQWQLAGEPKKVLDDFLSRAAQLRSVVYVQGDWLLATVLRPPLYEDLLQLPRLRGALTQSLDLEDSRSRILRGGLIRSNTAAGRRLIARQQTREGLFFWQSTDQTAADGDTPEVSTRKLLLDALPSRRRNDRPPRPSSQVLFSLRNGLPGFFVANGEAKGEWRRRPSAVDAAGNPMRNGLACARCHLRGPEPFVDAVSQAVHQVDRSGRDKDAFTELEITELQQLYRGQNGLDAAVKADRQKVAGALGKLGDLPDDNSLLNEIAGFRAEVRPQPGCLVPLDGLALENWQPDHGPLLEFVALNHQTKEPAYTFTPRQRMALKIRNIGNKPVFFELLKVSLNDNATVEQPVLQLGAGETYDYPGQRPKDSRPFETIEEGAGTDTYILFAAYQEFPTGVRLYSRHDRDRLGTDRILHDWYGTPPVDLNQVTKKTLKIETKDSR
jgi:hypothetical protein